MHDNDVIARKMNDQFETIRTGREPPVKRFDRVLRRELAAAPMGKDERAWRCHGLTHEQMVR